MCDLIEYFGFKVLGTSAQWKWMTVFQTKQTRRFSKFLFQRSKFDKVFFTAAGICVPLYNSAQIQLKWHPPGRRFHSSTSCPGHILRRGKRNQGPEKSAFFLTWHHLTVGMLRVCQLPLPTLELRQSFTRIIVQPSEDIAFKLPHCLHIVLGGVILLEVGHRQGSHASMGKSHQGTHQANGRGTFSVAQKCMAKVEFKLSASHLTFAKLTPHSSSMRIFAASGSSSNFRAFPCQRSAPPSVSSCPEFNFKRAFKAPCRMSRARGPMEESVGVGHKYTEHLPHVQSAHISWEPRTSACVSPPSPFASAPFSPASTKLSLFFLWLPSCPCQWIEWHQTWSVTRCHANRVIALSFLSDKATYEYKQVHFKHFPQSVGNIAHHQTVKRSRSNIIMHAENGYTWLQSSNHRNTAPSTQVDLLINLRIWAK